MSKDMLRAALTLLVPVMLTLSPTRHARAQPALASPPAAETDAIARRAQTLARQTMSPFCPGKTIDSCPSPRAQAWRSDIRSWLAEGRSPAEIEARLQARVPDFDLAGRPGAAWDWALPVGSVALATLWLLILVWRLRPRGETQTTPNPEPADSLDQRIDNELDRMG